VTGVTSHRVLTLLVAWLLVATTISGAATAALAGPATASLDSGGAVTSVTAENNTTVVRHENPSNTSRRGDLAMLQRWLAGRMGQTLIDCTEGARAREWGACDMNESYPDWVSKYVDVASETDFPGDDNATDDFRKAKENQQTFNDRVREFYETYDEYQEARENGNTQRARRLARDLRRLQPQVNGTGDRLAGNYRGITRNTNANLTGGVRTIRDIQTNVTETTEGVSRAVFVETNLTVTATTEAISFTDPLELNGQLTTANGTALANRTIQLRIGSRSIETTTDAEGRFTATYRPTTISLDAETVTVQFQPRNDSIYLPATDSVPVRIEQVATALSTSASPAAVAFDETVRIDGSVTAGGFDAEGVPVDLYIGQTQVATVRSADGGDYSTLVRLPASVAPGNRTVRAVVPLENRALAGSMARAPLAVESTPTNITLNASQRAPREIQLDGSLRTAAGTPLAGRTIAVRVNGTTIETVRTNADGRYQSRVAIPTEVPRNATITVGAQFDGGSTNLDSALARRTFEITAPPPQAGGADSSTGILDRVVDQLGSFEAVAVALAFGLLAVALLLAWRYREAIRALVGEDTEPSPPPATEPSIETVPDVVFPVDLPEVDEETTPPTLLEIAEQRLSQGDADAGAIASYAALRRALAARVGQSDSLTHWEFYSLCEREDVDTETVASLREATETYEQAAFAPFQVSIEHARRVLELVRPGESTDAQPGD
jgi:pimeloyl-ACP methyl ester carboxylesterase